MPLLQEEKKYTYAEYIGWPESEYWELVSGIPYMQAAPSWQHQSITGEIFRQISNFLLDKTCNVFASPFDLCLAEDNESDEDITNIFQPDIVVVCDETKLRKTGYFGVPTLAIEVSSPATAKLDKILKFNKYEKAGIKEYWIVEPEGMIVSVYTLQNNNRYGRPEAYADGEIIKVGVLQELEINLSSVFSGIKESHS